MVLLLVRQRPEPIEQRHLFRGFIPESEIVLAHPITISLLHMRIIVVLIRSGPRQREVVHSGLFSELDVDEFTTIIEFQSCHRIG